MAGEQRRVVVGNGLVGHKLFELLEERGLHRQFQGIVGDKGGVANICPPIFRQGFDLATGQCLDSAALRVPVFRVRVRGGRVEGGPQLAPAAAAEAR